MTSVVSFVLGGAVGLACSEAFGWWGLLITVPACIVIGIGSADIERRLRR